MKKYIIYKITNNSNGYIYIGKHETYDLNDGYMGSGKLIKRAQSKHGLENFTKEILHIFDNEDQMVAKEAELVTEDFCARDDNYNLCPGGKGGWGYINSNGRNGSYEGRAKSGKNQNSINNLYINLSEDKKIKIREKITETKAIKYGSDVTSHMTKAAWSKEVREKRQLTRKAKNFQVGENNSHFGKRRIKNPSAMQHSLVHEVDLEFWLNRGWVLGKFANGIGTYVPYKIMKNIMEDAGVGSPN